MKYGEDHVNRECKKAADSKPTCGLCGGKHIANYKWCLHYKKLINSLNKKNNNPVRTDQTQTSLTVSSQRSYADITAVRVNSNTIENNQSQPHQAIRAATNGTWSRLEIMFEKMISQNVVILELLTKLLSKLM